MIPWIAGSTIATLFSAALLTIPAALAVRRLIRRRLEAPFERGAVERHLVLAAAVIGGIGAVAWADAFALALGSFPFERGEVAAMLLGFLAPLPLAAVPWAAGEALSGESLRPWRALAAAAASSSAVSWASYAICWAGHTRELSPEIAVIQLAAAMLAGMAGGGAYLATRGEPRAQLPPAALELLQLDQ